MSFHQKRIGENGLRNKAINRITQWSEQNPLHDKRKAPLTKLTADWTELLTQDVEYIRTHTNQNGGTFTDLMQVDETRIYDIYRHK